MIDNHIYQGNDQHRPLQHHLATVMDISDRELRNIVIVGGKEDGRPRQTGFDISVASEVMAALGVTTSLKDMRDRFERIVIGQSKDKKPVTAGQLGAAGAMTVLMKEAIGST